MSGEAAAEREELQHRINEARELAQKLLHDPHHTATTESIVRLMLDVFDMFEQDLHTDNPTWTLTHIRTELDKRIERLQRLAEQDQQWRQHQPPQQPPQPQTNAFVPRNPPPPTFSLLHPPTLPSLSEPPQPKPPEYLRPGGHVPFTDQRPPFIPSHWVPFIGLDGRVAWMEPTKVNTSQQPAEVGGDWRPDWVIEAERQQEATMTTATPVAFAYERPAGIPLTWHYHVGPDGRVGWIPPPEEQYNGFTMAYYPDKDEWAYV